MNSEARIAELEARVSSLELAINKGMVEIWKTIYLLNLRTMTSFDDDPVFCELRDLILSKDGGDEMVEFHQANLADHLKRQTDRSEN